MDLTPQWLGWDTPALHLAADLLYDKFCCDGDWDLSQVVLVVPGGRASRRILEIVAWRAEGTNGREGRNLFAPPRIVTPGRLPGALYTPPVPIASEVESALARMAALRQLPAHEMAGLFSRRPAEQDVVGWLGLASEVGSLDQEMASECVTFQKVLRMANRADDAE